MDGWPIDLPNRPTGEENEEAEARPLVTVGIPGPIGSRERHLGPSMSSCYPTLRRESRCSHLRCHHPKLAAPRICYPTPPRQPREGYRPDRH